MTVKVFFLIIIISRLSKILTGPHWYINVGKAEHGSNNYLRKRRNNLFCVYFVSTGYLQGTLEERKNDIF